MLSSLGLIHMVVDDKNVVQISRLFMQFLTSMPRRVTVATSLAIAIVIYIVVEKRQTTSKGKTRKHRDR